MEGITNIADDFIVVGRAESLTDAHVDNDNTVLELLKRLFQHNLKLNPNEIKLKPCTTPFIGLVLSQERLAPSTKITNAVLTMPKPQEKAANRRLLGTITYLSRFCPNLSEVVIPLRDLTHVNNEFLWADQHAETLTKATKLGSESPCLRYFVHAPVILFWKSERKPAWILRRKPYAPSLRKVGQTTKLQYWSLCIHVGLFIMNLPYRKDSYSNTIVLSYLLPFDQTFFTSFLQVTIVPSLPSDMLCSCVFWPGLNSQIEGKNILFTAENVDLALLHTFSPAQCLLGRTLHIDLQQYRHFRTMHPSTGHCGA